MNIDHEEGGEIVNQLAVRERMKRRNLPHFLWGRDGLFFSRVALNV
jgi:hypothetical protein